MSVRPITDTLRILQGGTFLDTASEKLAEAVKCVDETGKAGKLTIIIDIKKTGAAVTLLAKVTNKAPEASPDPDMFWPTVEGNLSTDNPSQRKLQFGKVDQTTGEIQDADIPARAFATGA